MMTYTTSRRLLMGALMLGVAAASASVASAQSSTASAPVASAQTSTGAQPASLSLEQALALAEQRSEAVRIAAAGATRARAQVDQARSQLLPQLNGTIGYQRTLQSQFQEIARRFSGGDDGGEGGDGGSNDLADNPLARVFASENTVTLGLQLNQTLFTGGRLDAQRRIAAAGRRAADLGYSTAIAQARLEVTQAYYDALLADRMVAIAESALVQTERTVRQATLARRVGTTAEFDVLRAQVARDNQRPAVIGARTQRDVAHLRLRQLLDFPLDSPLRLTTALEEDVPVMPVILAADTRPIPRVDAPVDVDALLDERAVAPEVLQAVIAASDTTVSSRAAVQQAGENVVVQQQALRAARAERLPAISLSSNYQRFAYPVTGLPQANEFFPNWTVSLGLSVPIFTGGRIAASIRSAEAGLVEARAQLQQAQEVAALDAQLAYAQLEQAAEAYLASAGTAEQAQRAYTIAEVRYREGISTQVELNDSRLLLQQSLANRAQAARDLNVARVRLTLLHELPLGAGLNGGSGGAGAGSGFQPLPAAGGGNGATMQRATQPGASAGGAGFTTTGQTGGM